MCFFDLFTLTSPRLQQRVAVSGLRPPFRSHKAILPRIVALLLPTVATLQATEFSVDDLIRDSFVVDGQGTYYLRPDPQSDRSEPFTGPVGTHDFGQLKEFSGRNLTVMNVRGERSLEAQVELFADGTYKNALVVRNFSDIVEVRNTGKFGVLFYIQTWDPLNGSVDNIERWHDKGLRIFHIAYGRGHQIPVGDVLGGGSGETGGLTSLGESVVAELNRLRMVIDVSHANDRTTIDVCRSSKAPVVANHANCRAVTDVSRNKSDEALVAIAETGGVIGITTIGWMIEGKRSGKRDVDAFIEHVDHLRKLVGIDHIGLSSDGYLNGWPADSSHYSGPELSAPDRWRTVAQALMDKGYKTEEIKKILGLNWVRAYKAILPP